MLAVIWLVFIIAAVYFLMIRPQKRRMMEHQALIDSVTVGTRIVTAGGIHGEVQGMEDDVLRLEIAPGVTIRVAKRAVARNLDRELAIPEELPPDDAGAGEEA